MTRREIRRAATRFAAIYLQRMDVPGWYFDVGLPEDEVSMAIFKNRLMEIGNELAKRAAAPGEAYTVATGFNRLEPGRE